MRYARKDTEKFITWVRSAAIKPLNTYHTSSGHIGFCDAETGVPIRRHDGSVLQVSSTPSAPSWRQNATNDFIKLGLIRESLLEAAKRRSKAIRDAETAASLRAELASLDAQREAKAKRLERLETKAA